MAHALTESSTFTASVNVPDGGDPRTAASVETPFQAVTNRTKYLKDHVDTLEGLTISARLELLETFAGFVVDGTQDSGNRFSLTEDFDRSPSGNFTLSSDRVVVPATGTYLVIVTGQWITSDVTNPASLGFGIFLDDTLQTQANATRFSADGGDYIDISASITIVITNTATQRINVKSFASDMHPANGYMTIRRIQ